MANPQPEQPPKTLTYHGSTKSQSSDQSQGSTLSDDQQLALDAYAKLVKRERVTPRQWLSINPTVPCNDSFREQLCCHYFLSFPAPALPGFKILDVLGEGGMGLVYLGYDNKLERLVAIKEITSKFRADKYFQERFRLEGIILAKLDHPNIVRVYQFVEHAGRDFICMEYVDQGSLADLLRPDKFQPVATAIPCIIKLADAVDYAHQRKVIHRDLKPGNILFSSTGEPKVTDFGLAKLQLDDAQASGARVGTAAYMSPEQVQRKGATASSDVWALGVILYRILNGYMPFAGTDQDELFANIQHKPPGPFRASVPVAIQAICHKCLAKDPSQRYASARELAEELQSAVGSPSLVTRVTPKHVLVSSVAVVAAVAVLLAVWMFGGGQPAPVKMLDAHAGECRSNSFMTDGLHAVSEDHGAELIQWNLQTKQISARSKVHGISKPDLMLSGIVFVSPDGSRIAGAGINFANESMQILQMYDPQTLATTSTNFTINALGRAGAFSQDGKLLAVCMVPWSIEKWTGAKFGGYSLKLYSFEADTWRQADVPWEIKCLAFAPDSRKLVTCGGGNDVTIWSLGQSLQKQTFAAHIGGTDWVAYSADGKYIYTAAASEDALGVWDSDGDHRLVKSTSMQGAASKIVCCSLGKNGQALTGHTLGEVILWNLATGQPIYKYQHSKSSVTAIALSFDGRQGIVALEDHSVWLHVLPDSK